jgi:peptide/nickel transport system substrate-binding protein
MTPRWLFPLTLVAAVLAVAPSCERAPEPDARFVSTSLVKTLDPVESGDAYSGGAQHQVYEGLLGIHYLKRPSELIPAMAVSMPEVSEDGLTYTFTLRDDLFFHDGPCWPDGKGRKVTAADFVYCWKRLMALPDSKGSWLIENKIVGLDDWAERAKEVLRPLKDRVNDHYPFEHADMRAVIAEEVEGLRALDDKTLRIQLREPYPQFPWILAMGYAVVYPREALEFHGMEYRRHPIGTGPYTVREYWPFDRKILFERNPRYRECYYPSEGEPGDAEKGLLADAGKRLPFLDRVELVIIDKSQPRWLTFDRGRLDVIGTEKDTWEEVMTKDAQLKPELAERGIRLEKRPIANIAYCAFNMDDPILGTPNGERGKKVRQAMSLAYDVGRWIKVMRNGAWGTPALGPIPPTVIGYVDEPSPYAKRDLERAKQLLAEAGYPGGKGLPKLTYEMTGSDALARNGALIRVHTMKEIGVEIELSLQTWDKFMEKVNKKEGQLFGMSWSADYPDAQNFLQLFYGPHESPGPNNANYKNAEYDALYDQMKVMVPGPERDAVVRKMLRIINEDCPWSYTDFRVKYSYFHHWLRNYKYHLLNQWQFRFYRVNKDEKDAWMRKEAGR